MPKAQIFGGIVNLATGEEFEWDGGSVVDALLQCRSLAGTVYGLHWEFAGDIGEEGDICISPIDSGNKNEAVFYGKQAVAEFIAAYAD